MPGGRLRSGPPLRIVCRECRYRIYDYPRLCVGLAVVRSGSLLVLTRGHDPRRGWRDLPGGFLEAGEGFEAAARRELREETGLRVGRAEPLGTYWDRYFLRGFGHFPTLSFYYVARWRSGTPRAGDDAAAAEWVPLPRLSRLRLAWPHMRDVVRDVRRWLRRGPSR
jgi:8-oxo-dGTP diphosphatase